MTPSRSRLPAALLAAALAGSTVAAGPPAAAAPRPGRAVPATTAAAPDKGPVGWDAYRRLDRLPEIPVGVQARQFSSFDRSGGNDDGFDGRFSCPRVVVGGCLLGQHAGPGEITSMWFTRDHGDVTSTGTLRVDLDGRTVLNAPLQQIVDGRLSSPFVYPLVTNAAQSSGGVSIRVPMPFRSSMRVTTSANPLFFHIGYRVFADAVGVPTFDPADRAADVVALLRAAGTGSPVPTVPGSGTTPGAFSLAPGESATLADLTGPAEISALRLAPGAAFAPRNATGTSTPAGQATPGVPTGQATSGGYGSVTVALPAGAGPVTLTAATPAGVPPQDAPVSVDGRPVGAFGPAHQDAGATVQALTLPPDVTAGRHSITVTDLRLGAGRTVTAATASGSGRPVALPGAVGSPARAPAAAVSPDPPPGFPAGLRLRIAFDGVVTVDAPVDEFFGSGLGGYRIAALMMAVDPAGWRSAWWPMPFGSTAKVEVYNGSSVTAVGRSEVTAAPLPPGQAPPDAGTGYFRATSAAGSTRPGEDWTLLDNAGTGKVVGVAQTMSGAGPGMSFLEGDERFTVDGSRAPQWHGTGTEDFYEGGWYFNHGAFTGPLTGAPAIQNATGGCRYVCVAAYRTLLDDGPVFHSAANLSIEHGFVDDLPAGYASTTLWYGREDPSQRVTGVATVGGAATPAGVSFRPATAVSRRVLSSSFEGPDHAQPVTGGVLTTNGSTTLRLPVDPSATAVALRRTGDQGSAGQAVQVTVDGTPAGIWGRPFADAFSRWDEEDFLVPPATLNGTSTLDVTLTPVPGTPTWTASRYAVLVTADDRPDTTAPVLAAVNATAEVWGRAELTWRPAVDDSPAVHYLVHQVPNAGDPPSAGRLLGVTRANGFAAAGLPVRGTASFAVTAVDASGNVAASPVWASVRTGGRLLLEAESVPRSLTAATALGQDMSGYPGSWSRNAQLLVTPASAPATVTLSLAVPTTGTYAVSLARTQAPDFGRQTTTLDGVPLGEPWDGYASRIGRPAPVTAAFRYLTAGPHRLVVTVTGRNPASTGLRAGLDDVQLDDVAGTDPIVARYTGLGGARGILGNAVGPEHGVPAGIWQGYRNGRLCWGPDLPVHEVNGLVAAEFARLGGTTGLLGFPVTDELVTPDRIGRYNHFQGGSVYWTAATGAHEVHGAIRSQWAALGWERGRLGYPTADESAVAGGRLSRFQHGTIRWDAATARTVVSYT